MLIDQGKDFGKQARFDAWDDAHRKTIGWLFETGHLTLQASS
jgi:hypothetical protein